MGYIAYVAGTLIAAFAIHSLLNRRPKDSIREDGSNSDAIPVVSDQSVNEPDEDWEGFSQHVPSVTIEITHHEHDKGDKHESVRHIVPLIQQPSPTSDSSDSADDENVLTKSVTNTTLPKPQTQDMAPPPRISSAPNLNSLSTATQARQRTMAMPPPSSLPSSRTRSPQRSSPAINTRSLAPPRAPPTARGGFARPTGFTSTTPTTSTPARSLGPPPSAASSARSLGVPQQKVLANTHMQPSTSTQHPSSRPSRKIVLSPGHSPLDWAALTRSALTSPESLTTLRGTDASSILGPHRLGRITPSQLRKQTGRKGKDAWTSYQGRVYNVTAYLDFHPGGRDELMKGAGRGSDALFAEVHPWVNWEGMLRDCLVGMLVAEDDPEAMGKEVENKLDEMD